MYRRRGELARTHSRDHGCGALYSIAARKDALLGDELYLLVAFEICVLTLQKQTEFKAWY